VISFDPEKRRNPLSSNSKLLDEELPESLVLRVTVGDQSSTYRTSSRIILPVKSSFIVVVLDSPLFDPESRMIRLGRDKRTFTLGIHHGRSIQPSSISVTSSDGSAIIISKRDDIAPASAASSDSAPTSYFQARVIKDTTFQAIVDIFCSETGQKEHILVSYHPSNIILSSSTSGIRSESDYRRFTSSASGSLWSSGLMVVLSLGLVVGMLYGFVSCLRSIRAVPTPSHFHQPYAPLISATPPQRGYQSHQGRLPVTPSPYIQRGHGYS